MSKRAHTNICDWAGDSRELYQLWDNDLKKTMRKRQLSEFLGFAFVLISIVAWHNDRHEFAVFTAYLALVCLYGAIKFMIDESNVNYLLHHWDTLDAIRRIREWGDNPR
jgi:hypothetical protein